MNREDSHRRSAKATTTRGAADSTVAATTTTANTSMDEEQERTLMTGAEEAMAEPTVSEVDGIDSCSSSIPAGFPHALFTEGYSYGVRILADRLSVQYVQKAMHALDVGTVRSDVAIPKAAASSSQDRSGGVYYFELHVVSTGEKNQITIGVAPLHSSCLFAPAGMQSPSTPAPAQASRSQHDTASMACRQVGSDSLSYGYRGDEGKKFHGSNAAAAAVGRGPAAIAGTAYGTPFVAGDTVGCGVNFFDGSVFFTKNGRNLGVAFHLKHDEGKSAKSAAPAAAAANKRPELNESTDLYAAVSLHSKGEHVKLNFGATPFVFDVAAFQALEKAKVQRAIGAIPFDNASMMPLIRSYLLHQGYEKSLEALQEGSSGIATKPADNKDDARMSDEASSASAASASASAASSSSPPSSRHDEVALSTLSARRGIRDLIESGSIEAALSAISSLAPALWSTTSSPSTLSSPLSSMQALHFRLLSLQFVSVLTTAPPATRTLDAIEFAQRHLVQFQNSPDEQLRAQLEQVMATLAYADVRASPLAHLLTEEYRQQTADFVNAAILASLCAPPNAASNVHGVSSLELLLRHALALETALKQQVLPVALPALMDSQQE